jgi:hypothetical protein
MTNTVKLTIAAGLGALCCAIPMSPVVARGLFQLGASNWGLAGGLALVAIAAVGIVATRRKRPLAEDRTCGCGTSRPPRKTESPAIACSLSASDYGKRMRMIQQLGARSLVSSRRTPLTVHLVYRSEAESDVRAFVDAEAECCPFLTFAVSKRDDGVHVDISAPRDAAAAASDLFSQLSPEPATH